MSTPIIFLVEANSTKTYHVKKNDSLSLIAVDLIDKSTNSRLLVNLEEYAECQIEVFILNNGYAKNIQIEIIHHSFVNSNTIVKALSAHRGETKINLINKTPPNTKKITQNQIVDAILFDQTSRIIVTPSMLIDTNIIKASHAVNIGNINPEQLFYLMSRGVSKSKAITTILQGMFISLMKNSSTNDLYNKALTVLKRMIKGNNGN
ncbi:MAG: SufD family Fe-S cluster assembly protein [Mycoplasmataceae bacterium]|jgi:Fe-S cluster assembly protein SufD|nr:SufD family Fe-S cluster assembly protein [Mycoplasmataceae bacterium]